MHDARMSQSMIFQFCVRLCLKRAPLMGLQKVSLSHYLEIAEGE